MTKHITVKYHHFRLVIQKDFLLIKRVDTHDRLGGIVTIPLAKQPLEYLQKQIMGWPDRLLHGNSSIEQVQAHVECTT